MKTLIQLIQAHPYLAGIATIWVVSGVASALPRPTKQTGFYVFFYNFMAYASMSLKEVNVSKNGNGVPNPFIGATQAIQPPQSQTIQSPIPPVPPASK